MLNRHGIVAVVAGVVSIIAARVFGILELYIIGAGFIAAAAVALAIVLLRRPRLRAGRWIHPAVLVAGDVGRVDLRVEHLGSVRSSEFVLSEQVQRPRATSYLARLPVPPIRSGGFTSTGYQLMASGRGIVRLGPLVVENRDPLGMARARTTLLDLDEVFVAPRSYLLDMPQLGPGFARCTPPRHGAPTRPWRLPWIARVRRRRRAAVDPLEGIGAFGTAAREGAHERGSAPVHDRPRLGGGRRIRMPTGSSGR